MLRWTVLKLLPSKNSSFCGWFLDVNKTKQNYYDATMHVRTNSHTFITHRMTYAESN